MPDPTGATITALVRLDTGGTVSGSIGGSGTAWVLTITEPQPGLMYAYTITFTFAVGSSQANGFVTGTNQNPVGTYTSYALLCQKYGTINITRWSNHDNNTTQPDYNNISLGISNGESFLDQYWANGPYFTPLTPAVPLVQDWASTFSAKWIYETRGLFEDDPIGNKLMGDYNQALSQMALYKGNTQMALGCQRRWPSPTAAVPAFRGWR
jgi:hypothetical protein